ncbi:hypothetical protein VTK73DRAFT_5354 [Phialemonium thermophilum]|uniref:Uncharacterized protein n=1 Tax=Phialemonium thermophilum TaxID=223376 RepID=A0ABR3Y8V2_9PEZI
MPHNTQIAMSSAGLSGLTSGYSQVGRCSRTIAENPETRGVLTFFSRYKKRGHIYTEEQGPGGKFPSRHHLLFRGRGRAILSEGIPRFISLDGLKGLACTHHVLPCFAG